MDYLGSDPRRNPGQGSWSGSLTQARGDLKDTELEDLIHSWKRVTDPKLRRIALDLIRSMASS